MTATCPWSGWAPGTISFCEERICAWVVEPSNAWSNLAYVFFGILTLVGVGTPRVAGPRTELVLVGVANVLIGIGSFAFHATGTRVGEVMDLAAMYLITSLCITLALHRLRPRSVATLWALFLALAAGSVGLMLVAHTNGIVLFAIQLVIGVGLEVHATRRDPRGVGQIEIVRVVVTFLGAFAIWNTDKWGLLCDPRNHLVTGHAAWHTLCGLTVFFYARHQALLLRARAP